MYIWRDIVLYTYTCVHEFIDAYYHGGMGYTSLSRVHVGEGETLCCTSI